MAFFTLGRTDPLPPELAGGAVTVGNFDGVHRGHAALVGAARALGPAVAVTFDPPPAVVLGTHPPRPPLTTLADRAALLHATGADHVVALRTDPGLLALPAAEFVEGVLLGWFRAKAVVEGYDFRFGRGRAGDVGLLRELCGRRGVRVEVVGPVEVGGGPVSSSRVRAAVVAGDVAAAAQLLGREYAITGEVVTGVKRGRTLGFPTANLGGVETVVPGVGVYAVRAAVGGRVYPAAANVGPNPTFGEDARKIEVHLIDFAGDLYGQRLTAAFVTKLRDTRPFAGPAELAEQLKRDVAAARGLLLPGFADSPGATGGSPGEFI